MPDDVKLQQAELAPATVEAEPYKPLARGWDGQRRFDFGDGGEPEPREDEPPIRVMALHALLYCERLFYLEEVEEIRIADAAVYAGRRLHEELAADEGEIVSLVLESETLGIRGKVDCLRRRDGRSEERRVGKECRL